MIGNSAKEQCDIDRLEFLKTIAKKRGISIDALLEESIRLKIMFNDGGGWEGAKERLKWAEDYLKRRSDHADKRRG